MRTSFAILAPTLTALLAACGSTTTTADLPSDAADAPGDVTNDAANDAPPADTWTPHVSKKKAALYDERVLPLFTLAFTEADWAQFQAYRQAGQKEYVPCTFGYAGETAATAACRSKANADYWAEEKKPQFLVRFNHFDNNARFRGLRAVVLEASPFHSAPVRDRVAMEFFRDAGLMASLANHVRLQVNGADYGVYMNIENVDREFLEDRVPDPTGNLFENGDKQVTNEGTDPTDLWALNDLVDAEPLAGDHAAFFDALDGMLDMPEVLRFMAAETAFPTGDNFTNGGTNYLWYHDNGAGFRLIPWDLDDVLSEWGRPDADPFAYWGEPEVGLPPCKICQLIHQNPAWHADFIATLKQFRDVRLPALKTRIATVCSQVRAAVEADPYRPSSDMDDFDRDCADAQARVDQRIAFLQTALP